MPKAKRPKLAAALATPSKRKATKGKSSKKSHLDAKLVLKACTALLGHHVQMSEKEGSKQMLFDEDIGINLVISLKRIPKKKQRKPVPIALKHPLYREDATEVCLFVKDPVKDVQKAIDEQQVEGVDKVMGIKELKKEFRDYESKRLLADSYDLFLCDDRVMRVLAPLIGKKFFKKKKHPFTVDVTKIKTLQSQINALRDSTALHLTGGTCLNIKVGTTGMTPKQLAENIRTVVDPVVAKACGEWEGVLSMNVKTTESIALPIYHAPTLKDGIDEFAEDGARADEAKRSKPPVKDDSSDDDESS